MNKTPKMIRLSLEHDLGQLLHLYLLNGTCARSIPVSDIERFKAILTKILDELMESLPEPPK